MIPAIDRIFHFSSSLKPCLKLFLLEKSLFPCLKLLEMTNVKIEHAREKDGSKRRVELNNESNKTILEVDQVPNGRIFA